MSCRLTLFTPNFEGSLEVPPLMNQTNAPRLSDYPMRIVILSERSESKDLSFIFQHLTTFFSSTSALFCTTEHLQLFCYQPFPHSFSCNGGGSTTISSQSSFKSLCNPLQRLTASGPRQTSSVPPFHCSLISDLLSLSPLSCRPLVPVSSLECAVPRFRALSALECAVTKTRLRNSFRMRSSEKMWGGG